MRKLIFTVLALFIVFSINAQTTRKSKSAKSKSTSRSAKTGQYVTKSYADKHRSTTYTANKKSK